MHRYNRSTADGTGPCARPARHRVLLLARVQRHGALVLQRLLRHGRDQLFVAPHPPPPPWPDTASPLQLVNASYVIYCPLRAGHLRPHGGVPGRGVIENKHSTDVESPSPPPPCVCMSIHPEGESCSDLGWVHVLSDPAVWWRTRRTCGPAVTAVGPQQKLFKTSFSTFANPRFVSGNATRLML